jgi:hypothetical protein
MEIDRNNDPGDEADRANYFIESVIDDHVNDAMRRAAEMPHGIAGDCQYCGEWYGRLINDACGFCRDKFRL